MTCPLRPRQSDFSMRTKVLARTSTLAFIILTSLGIFAAPAAAQSRRKVIRLEAIKVEGRIQKPQAFYILQRSNLNFAGLELRQSFLPKIVKSVEEEPF